MKKLLLMLSVCFILAGCSAKEEESSEAAVSSLAGQEISASSGTSSSDETSGDESSTTESVTESSTEDGSLPDQEEFEYKNVRNNPFYIEQAEKAAASDGTNIDINDSEEFDSVSDMKNSVWGEYFSRKTGLGTDKLTPVVNGNAVEKNCTTHLDCYYVYYEYNKQYYGICITLDKYADINEMFDKEYSQAAKSEGFSLPSVSELDEQNGVVIDTLENEDEAVMLAALSSDGYEYQVFSYDTGASADDLLAFLKNLTF